MITIKDALILNADKIKNITNQDIPLFYEETINLPLTQNNLDLLIKEMKEMAQKDRSFIPLFDTIILVLNEEHKLYGFLNLPEFDYEDDLNRQLFMIQFFKEGKHTIDQLITDHLWMYTKEEIEKDIQSINKGSLSSLHLENNGMFVSVNTDINLVDTFMELKGYQEMCKIDAYASIALKKASSLWSFLNKETKNKILDFIQNQLNEDIHWFQALDFYQPTNTINIKGASYALQCLKNNKDFYIQFIDDDGNKREEHVCFGYPYRTNKDRFFLYDPDSEELFFVDPYKILYCYPNKKYLVQLLND